ncbi:MAG: hypothetical protein Q6360_08420 [Candidatus Brocadiales bacterium]|nr:hypothetical protein [Candidatus Brocadiales bacterium]
MLVQFARSMPQINEQYKLIRVFYSKSQAGKGFAPIVYFVGLSRG